MASKRPPSILTKNKRPRLPNSLVGAAALISPRSGSSVDAASTVWADDAWKAYDRTGEYRFGVGWLANAVSKVNLVAALPPTSAADEPRPINLDERPDLAPVVEVVNGIAGGIEGHAGLLRELAIALTVPGVGYVLATADDDTDSFSEWRVLSNEEVRNQNGVIELRARKPDGSDAGWAVLTDASLLIKVWRSHPREGWKPDSPSRAVLGALRQIALFDAHIDATGDSQIAGNGLLILPLEMEFPAKQGAALTGTPGTPGADVLDGDDGDDNFVETLMLTMEMARDDPGSRFSRTPLVIKVPGDLIEKVQHITFDSPFDERVMELREAAIRRVALGLDMPPEVMLGMGDANHWSAWQITEEAITLQVEPITEIIVHALTKFYLRGALRELGLGERDVVVWYDTTDLRTRPDLGPAASEAHERGLLSNDAYMRERGLNPDDRPSDEELTRRILLKAAEANPGLYAVPILSALGMLPAGLDAIALPEADPIDTTEGDDGDAPVDETRAIPERSADAAAILAAADGIVYRALERSGMRQRAALARSKKIEAGTITMGDPTVFHVEHPATEHASIEHLLGGAWSRVPHVAARLRIDPDALEAALSSYTAALIAAGQPHDEDRLATALGALTAR